MLEKMAKLNVIEFPIVEDNGKGTSANGLKTARRLSHCPIGGGDLGAAFIVQYRQIFSYMLHPMPTWHQGLA